MQKSKQRRQHTKETTKESANYNVIKSQKAVLSNKLWDLSISHTHKKKGGQP